MADTRWQVEYEDWVRREWMPTVFGQSFTFERVSLSSGGVFDFDAVSVDKTIIGSISTAQSGKHGKALKNLRSDMLFLLLSNASRKLIILCEPDMHALCQRERDGGRVPKEIEFFHAPLPDGLALRLAASSNQFRLSRLNIFLFDFKQASRFARYILERKWPKVMKPQSTLGLVRMAFNTSLIISYSRPFHGSRDGAGLPDARLNPDVAVLNDTERTFHQKVFDKRDQAYAHSDAIEHEFEELNYSGSMIQLYKHIEPLTIDEARMLRGMTGKWIDHVESLRTSAKQNK